MNKYLLLNLLLIPTITITGRTVAIKNYSRNKIVLPRTLGCYEINPNESRTILLTGNQESELPGYLETKYNITYYKEGDKTFVFKEKEPVLSQYHEYNDSDYPN